MSGHGNGEQSRWSRAQVRSTRPCPVQGGCGGDCAKVHPRGIVLDAVGQWRPMPPSEVDQ